MTQKKRVYCNPYGVAWELIAWLSEHGTQYEPALLPESVQRGKIGKCYDVSLLNAMVNKDLRYVEGIALSTKDFEWIQHAWLTDGTHAYDPTWRAIDKEGKEAPVPTIYIGIEIATTEAAGYVLATEYAGIMANAWRRPEEARKILPEGCPIIKP